jgi:hypothetical protein
MVYNQHQVVIRLVCVYDRGLVKAWCVSLGPRIHMVLLTVSLFTD